MEQDRNQPATSGMLFDLERRFNGRFVGIEQKMDSRFSYLDARFNYLAAEMTKGFASSHGMEERLRQSLHDDYERLIQILTRYTDKVETIDRREIITSHRVDELEKRS